MDKSDEFSQKDNNNTFNNINNTYNQKKNHRRHTHTSKETFKNEDNIQRNQTVKLDEKKHTENSINDDTSKCCLFKSKKKTTTTRPFYNNRKTLLNKI